MISTGDIRERYKAVDKLRAELKVAEAQLKAGVAAYARSIGLMATPRPETMRPQIEFAA